MAKRKFKGERLYKLLKRLVNFVTVIALLLGTFQLINRQGFLDRSVKLFDDCKEETIENYGEEFYFEHGTCMFYLDDYTDYENFIFKTWAVAIGLPVIFYGGTWLYNYLYPKDG